MEAPDLAALARGSAIWLPVAGRSMHPTMVSGDEVLVEPLQQWPPPSGSVVLSIQTDGSFVMHRVMSWTWRGLTTKGDARRSLDTPISRLRVLGIAVSIRRNGQAWPMPSLARARFAQLRERIARTTMRIRNMTTSPSARRTP
jgi:hypothetical protein